MPGEFITIENDSQKIKSTNYWNLPPARSGFLFLSANAGALRLLVPPAKEQDIDDMIRGVEMVIVTSGVWQGRRALEVLFEDKSDNPYAVHLCTEQTDCSFSGQGRRTGTPFLIYTEAGLVAEMISNYRPGKNLPHLKPWG